MNQVLTRTGFFPDAYILLRVCFLKQQFDHYIYYIDSPLFRRTHVIFFIEDHFFANNN